MYTLVSENTRYASSLSYIPFFIVCIGFVLSEIQVVAAESFPQVRFTPLPSDILPSNEVRKLYQDSDGYIWIPTYNGLARYDGYGAITYGMRDVSNGLFNTFVNVVAEDHDKNLWIGTEHGLFRLDKVSGNIVADEYPELADCNIAVILCDTGNGIWIGGDKGLFRKMRLTVIFIPSRSPIRRVVPSRQSPPSSRMTN